jgi:hypothetical protein
MNYTWGKKIQTLNWAPMVHTCKLSHSGDKRNTVQSQSWTNSSQDPIKKTPKSTQKEAGRVRTRFHHKKGLAE